MTIDLSRVRIYIRPGVTDMRKGAGGLTALVQEEMKRDPFSGSVYIFCNRERKLLKAVWRDRTGFRLSRKRRTCGSLEKDKYPWPESGEEARELSAGELQMMLRGIDFFRAHKPLYYERVC
jgi:transposase